MVWLPKGIWPSDDKGPLFAEFAAWSTDIQQNETVEIVFSHLISKSDRNTGQQDLIHAHDIL